MNYPIRLLSRQCNPFTTEILAYINGAPQKIIVLSDLDEHMAFTAGNSFYEKGDDNVFIVSGGIQSPSAFLPCTIMLQPSMVRESVTKLDQCIAAAKLSRSLFTRHSIVVGLARLSTRQKVAHVLIQPFCNSACLDTKGGEEVGLMCKRWCYHTQTIRDLILQVRYNSPCDQHAHSEQHVRAQACVPHKQASSAASSAMH